MKRLAALLSIVLTCPFTIAADWTTWRADSQRSGYTSDTLSENLTLNWTWVPQHKPLPAWPRDERMSFDRANHVVVAAGLVCFGSSSDSSVTALDTATGTVRWNFITGGPVRFAPTAWQDRLFVTSDDGYLYALKLATGELIERWRGGPADDRVLGSSQIVSRWPARGGVVIRDDVLYWGAGIWQSEGIFLHAMDLQTGEALWTNDSSGGIEMPQPHATATAKSGVSAQGYLLANEERLFVPTGRAVPAAFERATGKFEYYRLQENTQIGNTAAVLHGELFYNGGHAYHTADGSRLSERIPGTVAAFPGGIIHGVGNKLVAMTVGPKDTFDRLGKPIVVSAHEARWSVSDVPGGTSLIVAGDKVVSSGQTHIATINIVDGKPLWTAEVDDVAYGLAVSDGRLFVSTASGAIHCFAAESAESAQSVVHQTETEAAVYEDDETIAQAATAILKSSGITAGYCVDLGCGDGHLAYELARQSDLFVVGIESDPSVVAEARRKLSAAGLYGVRVSIHQGSMSETQLPESFANVVVSRQSLSQGDGVVDNGVDIAEAARLQRPYGGVTCFGSPEKLVVKTRGAPLGAGEWTHMYSNPANTLCSTDTIKGPLTAVWYRDIDLNLAQRHGRPPSPLFSEGRLFAEGLDELLAVDAYNGRPLWRFEQPGVLDAYNADHLVGSAATGSNMCIANDSVFLRNGETCYRIDAATGKVKATFKTPSHPDGTMADWGYIACQDGILFGSTSNESHIVRHAYLRADDHMQKQFSESTSLFAIDIESGEQLWQYNALNSIRHNAIAIGSERIFLIDRVMAVDDLLASAPARRGEKPQQPATEHATGELIALDLKTGERDWTAGEDVFGTTLSFSNQHDILLMFYQPTAFRLPSEVGGRIAAFQAASGEKLWETKVSYNTRPLINEDTIIAHPVALDLLSGETKSMAVPRSYGCGQVTGSRNLLMFRSGTLGYYDFTRDAGTENYGGIRPGCWINALPVGGLVLVPDATAGCVCSYQNRSWMALGGKQ
jgi:outer membrane protein assembly factor BamB